jgi:Holliday junction resolvase
MDARLEINVPQRQKKAGTLARNDERFNCNSHLNLKKNTKKMKVLRIELIRARQRNFQIEVRKVYRLLIEDEKK